MTLPWTNSNGKTPEVNTAERKAASIVAEIPIWEIEHPAVWEARARFAPGRRYGAEMELAGLMLRITYFELKPAPAAQPDGVQK